jgi:hypothetical protein
VMEQKFRHTTEAAVGALKYEVAQVDAKVLLVVLSGKKLTAPRDSAGNRESRRKSTLFA